MPIIGGLLSVSLRSLDDGTTHAASPEMIGCEWTILFSWPVLPGTDAAEIFNVGNFSALLHR